MAVMAVVAVLGTATTRVGAVGGEWTAAEQQVVYEINQARRDPGKYLAALGLHASGILPRPPLAVNEALAAAAGFRAADLALTGGALGHTSSDGRSPNEVVEDFGYLLPWWWPDAGNNVESLFNGPEERLLSVVLASGRHRSHFLGQGGFAAHREIGMGSSADRRWWVMISAVREGSPTFVTGAVFADGDGDGRMDLGEGLEGVAVWIDGGPSSSSGPGGLWALPVADGRYVVRAAGAGFVGSAAGTVGVAGYNVGVDFISGRQAPLVFEYALCRGHEPTIIGTGGDDDITGTPGPDVIHGLGGNDTIRGLGGDDIICGGSGADTLWGDDGRDVLFGGGGSDWLLGGPGDDLLVGGRGDDRLDGGSGWDRGQGGPGSGDVCTEVEAATGCEG
jgi:uncharacterized protein YkwD